MGDPEGAHDPVPGGSPDRAADRMPLEAQRLPGWMGAPEPARGPRSGQRNPPRPSPLHRGFPLRAAAVAAALVCGAWTGPLAAADPAQTDEPACGEVTIAEMNWASASVAAQVAAIILSEGYGCTPDLVPGDTVPTVTSMTEKGEPDIAPEVWINAAREAVEKAVAEGRLKIAGEILSDGGLEGWWIPDYMVEEHPELTTLQAVRERPDLFPDKEEPGKGRFYGCPPGWACEHLNVNLFAAYGMEEAGFTLFNPGSSEGLKGAIARQFERRKPIFTYYWAPTAILGRYPLVRLGGMEHDPETWDCIADKDCADPQPNGWEASVVQKVVTSRFAEESPQAFEFLSRLSWSNEVVNGFLAWQDERQATARETAEHFLGSRAEVWGAWVPEEVAEKVKAGL